MRSIHLFLRNTNQLDLEKLLNEHYSPAVGKGYTWIAGDSHNPILFIGTERDLEAMEPENLESARQRLGGEPNVIVFADVSGRCSGRPEVVALATLVLSSFGGVVQDDDSRYSWSLGELESLNAEGSRFFDY